MKNPWLLPVSLFLLALSVPSHAAEPGEESKALTKKVVSLFEKRNWEGIEEIANECREGKLEFSDGVPQLQTVYISLAPDKYVKEEWPDKMWEEWYALLDDWEAAVPQSITIPGVRLRYWTAYAWKARGGEWAHKVEEGSWELFRERLAAGEGIFRRKLKIRKGEPFPCPGFYKNAISIALGQSWKNDAVVEEILRPVVAIYPRYFPIYRDSLILHAEKWGGAEDDDFRFIASLPKLIGGDAGKEMCARVLVDEKVNSLNNYEPDLVDWELVKDGMIEAIRKSPDSFVPLKRFLEFAYRYGDDQQREILNRAREADPYLVDQFQTTDWYGKAWKIHEEKPESSLRLVRYFRPQGYTCYDEIEHLSVDPENGLLSTSTHWKGVKIVALDSGKVVHEIEGEELFTLASAFSPSGRYHLVASRPKEPEEHTVTSFRVYENTPGGMLLLSKAETKCGTIEGFVFSPDEKKFFFMNRKYRGWGGTEGIEFFCWDWDKEGAVPEKFSQGKSHMYYRQPVVDPEKNAFYSGGEGISRFDIADLSQSPVKITQDPRLTDNDIKGFAFMDNGDVCVGVTWHNPLKGEMVLIDRSTGKMLAKRSMENVVSSENLLVATKSSDGKRDVIVTSGFSGSTTTWSLDFTEGRAPRMILESAIPGTGNRIKSLITTRTKDGKNLVIQGTEKGMIAIYEAK